MNKNENKENDTLKCELNINSIEEPKLNKSKIVINSKLDLNKLPLNTIIHENLLNFEGEYYKKLYEEAEKEEKKEFQKEYEIKEEIVLPNNINKNNNNAINNSNNINDTNNTNNNINNNQIKEENKKDKIDKEEKKQIKKNKNTKTKKEIENKSKSENNLNEIKNKNYDLLNNNNSHNEISIKKNENSYIINKLENYLIFKINIIYFEIKYDTLMGESISVIGSNSNLGEWKSEKALNLNWNKGNRWIGSFEYKEENDFEYKFILLNNGCVKEWEDGINRKFIFQQIKSLIEPNLANGTIIKLNYIMNQTLEYDYNNLSLKIISNWNIK